MDTTGHEEILDTPNRSPSSLPSVPPLRQKSRRLRDLRLPEVNARWGPKIRVIDGVSYNFNK